MANGSLLNINDIATTPLTEYGETRSIKDKFYDGAELEYVYDNNVYALPGFWSRLSALGFLDLRAPHSTLLCCHVAVTLCVYYKALSSPIRTSVILD